jgi:hypothetical protein
VEVYFVLDHIYVSPTNITLIAGSQAQFTAYGKDVYNNSEPGLTFTWTTNSGNVTGSGLFTADTAAGALGFVNASIGGKTGFARVTIVPDQLTHIVISPATVNVIAGESLNFTAVGYDRYNNEISGLTFTWTTDVGTMTASSLSAQTTAGVTGFVRATSGLVSGDASVTVVPNVLHHIDVSPSVLSAVAGSQTQFAAVGRDVYNNAISGLTLNWTANVGGIASSGLFTAQTTAGESGYVNASTDGKTRTANVTIIPDQLTHIIVTPIAADVIAGSTQVFTAVGYDQFDNAIPDLMITWTTDVGVMTGSSLTAQNATGASGHVRATSGVVSGSAFVTIVPAALDHINLSPAGPLCIVAGSQTQFSAIGMDVYNNAISGLTFTWTTTVGSVTSGGLFAAQTTAGASGYVSASIGLVKGSVGVTIGHDWLTHIVVTAATIDVVAGAVQNFLAIGYDQFDNSIPSSVFTWTTDVGTMTASSLSAQTTAGVTGFVRATSGLVSGDASVTVVPNVLHHIDVSPSVLSAVAGSQTQFAAVGRDVYNNAISGLTLNWTANVGGIASSGLFTAQTTAGESGYVNASTDGKTRTANVTIIPDQLTHIIVTPIAADVIAGSTQVFTAVGYDQFDNAIPDLMITWTTDVGVMTGNSLIAQTGYWVTGHVRASNGYAFGDASVSIQPRTLDLVVDALPSALVVVAIYLFTSLWSEGSKKPPVRNVKGDKKIPMSHIRSRNERQRH